jgi:hypothetical protein
MAPCCMCLSPQAGPICSSCAGHCTRLSCTCPSPQDLQLLRRSVHLPASCICSSCTGHIMRDQDSPPLCTRQYAHRRHSCNTHCRQAPQISSSCASGISRGKPTNVALGVTHTVVRRSTYLPCAHRDFGFGHIRIARSDSRNTYRSILNMQGRFCWLFDVSQCHLQRTAGACC